MGYLLPILTDEQRKYLCLEPDELSYLLCTTKSAAQSEDYSADGYSVMELLYNLINITDIEENIPLLADGSLLDVVEACLPVSETKAQEALLNWTWSLSTSKQQLSCSTSLHRVIASMAPKRDIHDLHKAVLFSLQHSSTQEGKNIIRCSLSVAQLTLEFDLCYVWLPYQ